MTSRKVEKESSFSIRYWKDGRHILVTSNSWDCFLHNEALNPMINWLNLHKDDIERGTPCSWFDKMNDIHYISVYGNLTIKTDRDVVFLTREQVSLLKKWLNEHREILSIREVAL